MAPPWRRRRCRTQAMALSNDAELHLLRVAPDAAALGECSTKVATSSHRRTNSLRRRSHTLARRIG
ncbi:MAG: hypothetical protein R2856_25220 [Caldilineaceae bacterium]